MTKNHVRFSTNARLYLNMSTSDSLMLDNKFVDTAGITIHVQNNGEQYIRINTFYYEFYIQQKQNCPSS